MKKLVFIVLLMTSVQGFAALSGYFQSAAEIKTILDSDEVYNKLGSAYPIQAIVNKTTSAYGAYEVTAGINTGQICTLNIRVKYLPPEKDSRGNILTGAAKPQLVVGDRTCN